MSGDLNNFSRNGRRNMTAAEEKLWHHLRSDIALKKTHFRRQVIFKTYIVDFCCHASRLIVEVDDATHSTDQEILKDEIRTHYLDSIGYRVVRVTNDDVFHDIGSVMDTIYAALEQTPHVLSENQKSQNPKRKIKKIRVIELTPTPYPRRIRGSTPQGGGEVKNDTAKFFISSSHGKSGNKSDIINETSSFPSPLEGEGQGGG